MRALSENLFLYEDTCNVYIVKNDSDALLIDFGSGDVLDRLEDIGVERVAGVWMTHHHRDQGQGLDRAVQARIPIWVPHTEQDLFRDADAHWQAREIYDNYNVRQDRFSLLRSVPIAGTLKDYETRTFGPYAFSVVPTPGHTTGSVSFVGDIDGRKVAFTGDLIAAPGKVWSLAATQWTYNGGEGLPATAASLLDLKDRLPDLLLPSHGSPMEDPSAAIDLLVGRLRELMRYRMQNPRLMLFREKPFEEITPHLLRNRTSMAYSYVLLSESGKALFFDFGYDFVTGLPAGTDRAWRRPWLYSLPALKRDYGVRKIDVVLPTHYHDDHVAGIPLLRDVEGTQVWAAENYADVLRHPARYDLPCLWYDPIPVDWTIPLETPIRWEEYELTLHELGGHTLYAVAISLEVDGKRVLVAGDQYQGSDGLQWNYVYQNRFRMHDYRLSAQLYRKLAPDVILTGHWDPLWVQPGYFDELDERGEALERLHRELLPLEEIDFRAEGFGAWIEPYQTETPDGTIVSFEAEIVNPFDREAEAEVRPVVPDGWRAEPETARVSLAPREVRRVPFGVAVPDGERVRRARIAVDLTVDGRRFGQQAEALVTVRPD